MKAVFISHNQALSEEISEILDELAIKGFTQWIEVNGEGSRNGEPHMGTHTWPALNNVLLTIVPDEKVNKLLETLSELDKTVEDQGLRAFVWNIESAI